ncbi:MAG: hypothetical protein M3378_03550 [Actinomycetota bacterium]|nr:hypothetical protein [Actinomycetota bacterium]MDQ3679615.1 hypothetical protein [Actinomycetota bacterium]
MDQTSDQPGDLPPDQPPDVLELLEADHHRVSELLARIGDGAGPVSEVTTHLVAESQLLYPSLRHHLPDADVAVDGLLETDHRIEQLLAEVDRGDADDAVAAELVALFAEHVRQQEALFAELHHAAEPEELLRLGQALGPVIMKAPTHPHPHLPREGTLEVISDAVASSVDHIRDALRREDDEA